MARSLRLEFEGAFYYITSRGNRRDRIFFDDKDREKFLEILDVWIPPPRICLDGKPLSPFSGNTKGKYLSDKGGSGVRPRLWNMVDKVITIS